jgi:hypothetical protein
MDLGDLACGNASARLVEMFGITAVNKGDVPILMSMTLSSQPLMTRIFEEILG